MAIKKKIIRQNIPEIKLQPRQLEFAKADQQIVFFGGGAGGGKTFSALAVNLLGINDPLYFSVFFRTTSTEIEKGLFLEAKRMYMPYLTDINGKFIGQAKINEQQKTITFPSGARTTFSYLATDRDADAWYGTEINCAFFEEAQYRSQYQFDVIRSRNRSMSKIPKSIRCTLNPSPDSFIYQWVKPFLDEDDFPVKEYSGKTRYFVIVEDNLYTSWDKEELEQTWGKSAETYTYIPATLDDNKALDTLDPSYRKKLDSLPEAKRKQLLLGCWAATENSGVFFKREYLKKATTLPLGSLVARGYDLAATADDTPNTKGCDRTASILMAKSKDGYYYILSGNGYRKRSGERDLEIIRQGHVDGDDVHIVLPCDHGAGGKAAFEYLSKTLIDNQLTPKKDPSNTNNSKLKKAEGFFSACQNGLVFIVESGFTREELETFYRELEIFDGVTKSTRLRHDDYVDAAATVFTYLNVTKVYNVPKLHAFAAPPATPKAEILDIEF